jgi:hypothetical protein
MQFHFVVMKAGSSRCFHDHVNYTTSGLRICFTPTCSDTGTVSLGVAQYSVRPMGFDLFIDTGIHGQMQHWVFAR